MFTPLKSKKKNYVCQDCKKTNTITFEFQEKYIGDERQMGHDATYIFKPQDSSCSSCNKEILDDDEILEEHVYEDDYGRSFNEFEESDKSPDCDYDFTYDISPEDDIGASQTITGQGKGDASTIIVGSVLIIYDFGLKKYWKNLKKALKKFKEIQYAILILSHGDRDHYGNLENCVDYLWDKKITIYYVGEENKKPDENVFNIDINNSSKIIINLVKNWNLVINIPDQTSNSNDSSLVVFILDSSSKFKSILTGDQNQKTVNNILKNNGKKDLSGSIYQIPHHGSKKSLEYSLLPEVSSYFVSGTPMYGKEVGYNNSCQKEIIQRLKSIAKKERPVNLYFTQCTLDEEAIEEARGDHIIIHKSEKNCLIKL